MRRFTRKSLPETLADKTPAHWPRPTENWWSDPQSELLDWQNPETGPKLSADPRSTVFFKSANPLDLSPKSTIHNPQSNRSTAQLVRMDKQRSFLFLLYAHYTINRPLTYVIANLSVSFCVKPAIKTFLQCLGLLIVPWKSNTLGLVSAGSNGFEPKGWFLHIRRCTLFHSVFRLFHAKPCLDPVVYRTAKRVVFC